MTGASSPNTLAKRFQALWLRGLSLSGNNKANEVFADLAGYYREPGRYYHDFDHIQHCLSEFDRVAGLARLPDQLEMAIWFHDAVYTPGATDNERRSAELFRRWSSDAFPGEVIDKIQSLIMLTRHDTPPGNLDEALLLDIDLSSFGQAWPAYNRDTQNLRQELYASPDHIYYPAHKRFLNMLLNRPHIYYSEFFQQRYEVIARQNILSLLATSAYAEPETDR